MEYIWDRLSREKRPIILYGMGDGADKLFRLCEEYSVKVCDIFASDEFVRGHSFHKIRVKRYSEILELYEDAVILLAFASSLPEVMQRIYTISNRYEVLSPDTPLFGSDMFTPDFYEKNIQEILAAREILADDLSRNVFDATLGFKLTGNISLISEITSGKDEVFGNIIKLSPYEHYVDLGAYDGDTIKEFLRYSGGKYASISALEPDDKNYKKLTANTKDLENIKLYPYASWSHDTELRFLTKGGRMSAVSPAANKKVRAVALDNFHSLKRTTYIKMDVEGAERETIEGCKELIKANLPNLAVSIYHRTEDFFTLPLLINRIAPEYRLYLRHHPYIPLWDTFLYATTRLAL